MNELALFAGAGGGILGGHLLGWRTVCAVEWEQYPASVLCARQNDGILPTFPIWDDIQTFDGKPWRGIVDVVSGGFPCQDISAAGKGAGIEGERSGMWKEMARVVCEVRPQYVFVENSPMLTIRGLGVVLADLAKMGFDAEWCVLGAADVGANHQRDRIWIKATSQITNTNMQSSSAKSKFKYNWPEKFNASSERRMGTFNATKTNLPDTDCKRLQRGKRIRDIQKEDGKWITSAHGAIAKCSAEFGTKADWWQFEPDVGRVANGVAARVHRLKAIGNGQVPLCAAIAWKILSD
jgi:DNA (cytosine-5)-methyltransferase 1